MRVKDLSVCLELGLLSEECSSVISCLYSTESSSSHAACGLCFSQGTTLLHRRFLLDIFLIPNCLTVKSVPSFTSSSGPTVILNVSLSQRGREGGRQRRKEKRDSSHQLSNKVRSMDLQPLTKQLLFSGVSAPLAGDLHWVCHIAPLANQSRAKWQ